MNHNGDDRAYEDQRLVLDAVDVSHLLGLSRGSVYSALASGAIPSIRIGRRILIPRSGLEELLAERRGKGVTGEG